MWVVIASSSSFFLTLTSMLVCFACIKCTNPAPRSPPRCWTRCFGWARLPAAVPPSAVPLSTSRSSKGFFRKWRWWVNRKEEEEEDEDEGGRQTEWLMRARRSCGGWICSFPVFVCRIEEKTHFLFLLHHSCFRETVVHFTQLILDMLFSCENSKNKEDIVSLLTSVSEKRHRQCL